jgi:hypothetical protein
MLFRLLLIVLFISILAVFPGMTAFAQAQVEQVEVSYTFGQLLVFQATVMSVGPIEQVYVLFREESDPETQVGEAILKEQSASVYRVIYERDLAARPLRAFSNINYHFRVDLKSGETFTSQDYHFYYEDNRYKWQSLEDDRFQVHWADQGGIDFGADLLEVARTGLQRVQSLIAAEPAGQIDIYAYPSTSELQETLALAGLNWVAGHADPDLGVMVVALPDRPEKRLLMEQRIPHELMHILLYQAVGPTYTNLPTWLNEGLASIAELYPNPDYQILLEDAYEKDALVTISSLCQPFPRDAYSANLAYAEAASFTRYLQQQYGSSGLSALVQGYADGLDCDRGVEMGLGKSLLQLERDWRKAIFSENPNQVAISSLMPWLSLLILILLAPLGLAISRLRSQPVRQLADED